MRNYVIINGVNSNTINGLAINELPPITKPPMRVLQEEIDGRDGDITTNLGYGAYDKVMTIGLFHTFDINQIIAFFNGAGTIVFSNEPDKKYNYKIIEQIDYEKLISFKTATVTLHCQPFKYPLEETPLIIEPTIDTLENVTSASIETNENTLSTTLKGNTSQDTTTGKNLIPTQESAWEQGNINADGNVSSTTRLRTIDYYPIKNDTNYHISVQDTNYCFLNIRFYDSSKTYLNEYYAIDYSINGVTDKTINIPSSSIPNVAYMRVVLRNADNTSTITASEITTIKPQIELGSSKTSWEEYTGGNPAPNPSYPQPVNVVTGDNEVVVCGKNLFDKDNVTDGYLLADGTTNDNTGYKTSAFIPIIPNTLYYKTYTGTPRTKFYDENKQPLNTTTYQDISIGASEGTFTTPNNAYYLRISVYPTYASLDTIMLHKGDTASTYEPYTSQTYEINLGKNLFDPSIQAGTYEQTTYTIAEDGKITQSTTDDSAWVGRQGTFYLEKGTYTFTLYGLTSSVNLEVRNYNNNTDLILASGDSDISRTFTLNERTELGIKTYGETSSYPQSYYIQIEKGTHSTTYSKYKQPIELCKIGDYQDYIYKDNGSWYIHKEIGKVVLNGSEIGTIESATGTNTYRFRINENTLKPQTSGYCNNNRFVTSGVSSDSELIGIVDTYIYYRINKTTIDNITGETNVAKFNTWLSTNNSILYVPLISPTYTIITNETLISQLEALKGATTYYGITNINQQNNDLPFIMDLSYMVKDTDKVIVDNIGNIYSKPTIALEGNGTGGIYLNDNQILSVELTDKMTISISDMEAFDPDTHALLNRAVTGNYNSMTLQPNENTIKITGGITKATITNYTRYL